MREGGGVIECLEHKIDFNTDKIAIYGTGMIGIALGKLLHEQGICFEYFIDQNDIEIVGACVVKPGESKSYVTKVIVTIMDAIDHDRLDLNISGDPELLNIFNICLE